MTALILVVHFGATVALFREVCQALALQWRGALAYGLAFSFWWGSLILLGVDIGRYLGVAYPR